MQKSPIIVVGGGASGIVAAISAKRNGSPVVICERMPRLGKKVLASGNGRCNLLNDKLDESFYNKSARGLVGSVFRHFGKEEIKNFFKSLGLKLYTEEGRLFPVTNQSSSVLNVLQIELNRLEIPVYINFDVSRIMPERGKFIVADKSGRKLDASSVIIAGGGMTYPALGSDGNAYKLSACMGHSIVKPVPAAVPLEVKDPICHILQGQKIFADVKSIVQGKPLAQASGDLLFTKYGLSGTAILDISEGISIAINRNKAKEAFISVDMVPFMDKDELSGEISLRRNKGFSSTNLLEGILPAKFTFAFKRLLEEAPDKIASVLKDMRFKVSGTRGWNEADFTAGGVETSEVIPEKLESRLKKGLYFSGEVLDINGERGGYNLAWAWASGFMAGLSASETAYA